MTKTIIIFDFHIHKINDDKTFNEDGFRNYVINIKAVGDHQKAIADEVATKCIEEVNRLSDENKHDVTKSGCSNIPFIAAKCVNSEFFKSCPAEKRISSEECVEVRNSVHDSPVQLQENELDIIV